MSTYVAVKGDMVIAGINARSWYDARAYASTRWPECDVRSIERVHPHAWKEIEMHDAPPILTMQEIAREHIESVERAAYMRGRKECAAEIIAHMEERIHRYASALSRRVLHALKEDIRKVFG